MAIEHADGGLEICCALKARGIVPDFRPPRIFRLPRLPFITPTRKSGRSRTR